MVSDDEILEWVRRVHVTRELRLAVERMNKPPVERLKWIVNFMHLDLARLQQGEKEAYGYDLRGLAVHSLGGVPGYTMSRKAMSASDLRHYHNAIKDGIRGLLNDKPWPMPEVKPTVVVAEKDAEAGRRRFALRFGGDEGVSILVGVANLIAEAGEHLRACPECATPFVATMKQARYSSTQCSQKARNKRRG